jgi:iron complex transport system permease protein
VRIDGLLLLGFGLRTPQAIGALHAALTGNSQMAALADQTAERLRDRRLLTRAAHVVVAVVLLGVAIASLAIGLSGTSLWSAIGKLLQGQALDQIEALVLWDIHAPRMLMGLCVGAALAVSGAVMQGLFRSPLADPGTLGVSAGAGLGALISIVLGAILPSGLGALLGAALLPIFAFAGAWAAMSLLSRLTTRAGRTSVATMLLAGIALAALTGALSVLLVFRADDLQLRELTFWQLGSLSGESWKKTLIASPVIPEATAFGMRVLASGPNALAMGEASAHNMGISVQRLKTQAILMVSTSTGAAVAAPGGISFSARSGAPTAIVGPNGSGKSTLLKALTGEIASTGTVRLGDTDIRAAQRERLAGMHAVLPQLTPMCFPFQVLEIVRHGLRAICVLGSS